MGVMGVAGAALVCALAYLALVRSGAVRGTGMLVWLVGGVGVVYLLLWYVAARVVWRPLRELELLRWRLRQLGELVASKGGLGEDGRTGVVELAEHLVEWYERLDAERQDLSFSNCVLARAMETLRTMLDALPVGVLAADSNGMVFLCNSFMSSGFGVDQEAVLGKALAEIALDERLLGLLSHADEGDGSRHRQVVEFDVEDGDGRCVYKASAVGINGKDGGYLGKVVCVEDITRWREMERLQHEFIDSVAHELRTPLTSITAYVEMLIDGEAESEELKYEFYNTIYSEAHRLSRLINNLLNLSKIETGAMVLNLHPVRLKRLLEDVMRAVEGQAAQKKVRLQVELPDRLPTMNLDKDLMQMALVNVVGNAVKYTPEGGLVRLYTSSSADGLTVHVSDTGIGIPPDERERIFEKFYRGSNVAEIGDKAAGSGVGLATARQVVRMHGGDITVESTPGQGSTFSVLLPRDLINASIGE